ncbi:hypothetical protein CDD83_1023 [Cordyceps sp. RAO-2017]|nr:hypothetical protein CDD83_1023 [Cordyceps sp. RAO-2017]
MTYWDRLPLELKYTILKILADGDSSAMPKVRAGYACVSREWSYVFERTNFRRVSVSYTRIKSFKKYFTGQNERRQAYLEHLQVLILLKQYGCPACMHAEDRDTTEGYKVFRPAPVRKAGY